MADAAAEARREAIAAHGECWRLLEKPDRTHEETAAMITAALKSLKLWQEVGNPVNDQSGSWLAARACVDAGMTEPALDFAMRTLELTTLHKGAFADFDHAFAEEVVTSCGLSTGCPSGPERGSWSCEASVIPRRTG